MQVSSDYCKMLGGDYKATAILHGLGFRANLEVDHLTDDDPVPDSITFRIDTERFISEYILGMFSRETVLHRMEYLKDLGFIWFDINTGGRDRLYTLNVKSVSDSLFGGQRFPAPPEPEFYIERRKSAGAEIRSSQRGNPLQPARKSAPLPLVVNKEENQPFNEPLPAVIKENPREEPDPFGEEEQEGATVAQPEIGPMLDNGRLAEGRETGNSEPEGGAPPSATPTDDAGLRMPAEDDIDTDTPIGKFCRHRCSRLGIRNPKLGTQANRELLEWLLSAEELNGTHVFRTAIVRWLVENQSWVREWLKERIRHRQPFQHFREHHDDYLGPRTMEPLSAGFPHIKRGSVNVPCEESQNESSGREAIHSGISKHEASRTTAVANPGTAPAVDPYPTPADLVAGWNEAVPSKPYTDPKLPKVPSRDSGFTIELWRAAAVKAEKVIRAKGDEVSWLTLRWLLKSDEVKGDNWRRIAEGELDFMAAPAAVKRGDSQQDQAQQVYEKYMAKLKAKKEKADGVD